MGGDDQREGTRPGVRDNAGAIARAYRQLLWLLPGPLLVLMVLIRFGAFGSCVFGLVQGCSLTVSRHARGAAASAGVVAARFLPARFNPPQGGSSRLT